MRDDIDAIHERGAELVVVGNGSAEQAGWFVEDTGLQVPVFTDPELRLHRALELRRGLAAVLDPRVFLRAIHALWKGFRQDGVKGDATQLGGLFVVDPRGDIRFAHRSRFAGDLPDSREFLEALEPDQSADP